MKAFAPIIFAAIGVSGCIAILGAAMDAQAGASTYALIGELHGEAYALDTGLSAEDCRYSLADARRFWGAAVTFTCEREG